MNFKNIKKFLKKNYKKIIVVCLIMLLLSNKMYEKFSTTQALAAVKSTEEKVNNIFSKVNKDTVSLNKILAMNNKEIRLRSDNDGNHGIYYNKDIDGPEIKGYGGISLATSGKRVVEIKKDQVTHNAKNKFNKGFEIHDPKKNHKEHTVHGGWWGGWHDKTCADNEYVCGIKVRVEGKQGGGDDTGMNGLKMKCCKFNP